MHNVFESAESGAAVAEARPLQLHVAEEEIASLRSPVGDSVTPVTGAHPLGGGAELGPTSFDA